MISAVSCRIGHAVWRQIGSNAITAAPRRVKTSGCVREVSSLSQGITQPTVFLLPSREATEDLAATFATSRKVGDAYLIHGALGAGKSAFWYVADALPS